MATWPTVMPGWTSTWPRSFVLREYVVCSIYKSYYDYVYLLRSLLWGSEIFESIFKRTCLALRHISKTWMESDSFKLVWSLDMSFWKYLDTQLFRPVKRNLKHSQLINQTLRNKNLDMFLKGRISPNRCPLSFSSSFKEI